MQELIAVIRREHRRTQVIFGISIIILALVITFIAPGIIRMETNPDTGGTNSTDLPGASDMPATTTASGTAAQ